MRVNAVSLAAIQVINPANNFVMATALYIDGVRVDWPEDEIVNFVDCLPSSGINQLKVEELIPDEIEEDFS